MYELLCGQSYPTLKSILTKLNFKEEKNIWNEKPLIIRNRWSLVPISCINNIVFIKLEFRENMGHLHFLNKKILYVTFLLSLSRIYSCLWCRNTPNFSTWRAKMYHLSNAPENFQRQQQQKWWKLYFLETAASVWIE